MKKIHKNFGPKNGKSYVRIANYIPKYLREQGVKQEQELHIRYTRSDEHKN